MALCCPELPDSAGCAPCEKICLHSIGDLPPWIIRGEFSATFHSGVKGRLTIDKLVGVVKNDDSPLDLMFAALFGHLACEQQSDNCKQSNKESRPTIVGHIFLIDC